MSTSISPSGRRVHARSPQRCGTTLFIRRCLAIGLAAIIMSTGATAGGPPSGPLSYHATVLTKDLAGSSYLIADGIAVTNAHVIGNLPVGSRVRLVASRGHGQTEAVVLAISPRIDLALLRVPHGFLASVPPVNAPPEPGRPLVAAGVVVGPHGAGPVRELTGTVTSGIMTLPPFGPGFVAAVPGIRSGFSGGPVFDPAGRFIGMTAALRGPGAGSRRASGAPTEGTEAFILTAGAVREEVERLRRALP